MKRSALFALAVLLLVAGCAAGRRWSDADLDELNSEVVSLSARLANVENFVGGLPQAGGSGGFDDR